MGSYFEYITCWIYPYISYPYVGNVSIGMYSYYGIKSQVFRSNSFETYNTLTEDTFTPTYKSISALFTT